MKKKIILIYLSGLSSLCLGQIYTPSQVIAGPTTGPGAATNVGIGGSAANNRLDVFNGDIDVDASIRGYMINNRRVLWHKSSNTNIFVGVQAGQNHSANGMPAENTFVGHNAGFSCQGFVPPVVFSRRNTFIGCEAGFSTNVALGATYVGYRAGYSHNSAPGVNTCVGYE